MIGKTGWSLLTAVVLVIASGLGYAAFSSQVQAFVTATAGSIDININDGVTTQRPPYATCTVSVAPDGESATITVSNLAPGDTCKFELTIGHEGSSSLPANLGTSVQDTDPDGVNPFTAVTTGSDTSIGPPPATATIRITVELPSGTGNSAQGEDGAFTITIAATAGT